MHVSQDICTMYLESWGYASRDAYIFYTSSDLEMHIICISRLCISRSRDECIVWIHLEMYTLSFYLDKRCMYYESRYYTFQDSFSVYASTQTYTSKDL